MNFYTQSVFIQLLIWIFPEKMAVKMLLIVPCLSKKYYNHNEDFEDFVPLGKFYVLVGDFKFGFILPE